MQKKAQLTNQDVNHLEALLALIRDKKGRPTLEDVINKLEAKPAEPTPQDLKQAKRDVLTFYRIVRERIASTPPLNNKKNREGG
jgi:hypothetical protein